MTDLQNAKKKYDELPIIKFDDFSLGFFADDKKTYLSTFNEHAKKEFKIKSEKIEYKLPTVTFVSAIQVKAIEPNTKLIIEYIQYGSNESTEVQIEAKNNLYHIDINKFITKFSLKSETPGFFKNHSLLIDIKVQFVSEDSIKEIPELVKKYCDVLDEIENNYQSEHDKIIKENAVIQTEKSQLEKNKADTKLLIEKLLSNKDKEIQTKEDELEKIQVEHDKADEKLSEIQKQLKAVEEEVLKKGAETKKLEQDIKELMLKLESSRSQKQQLDHEIDTKNKMISDYNQQIQELHKDKSYIAHNLIDFAKKCQEQFIGYTILIAVLILFAAWLSHVSIESTRIIYNTFVSNSSLGVQNLIAIKAFLIIFMAFAFTFIYKLTYALLNEVFTLNKTRIRLSEITILAQDISDASFYDLEIDYQDKIKAAIAVRMKLVREYFSGKLERAQLTKIEEHELMQADDSFFGRLIARLFRKKIETAGYSEINAE